MQFQFADDSQLYQSNRTEGLLCGKWRRVIGLRWVIQVNNERAAGRPRRPPASYAATPGAQVGDINQPACKHSTRRLRNENLLSCKASQLSSPVQRQPTTIAVLEYQHSTYWLSPTYMLTHKLRRHRQLAINELKSASNYDQRQQRTHTACRTVSKFSLSHLIPYSKLKTAIMLT